MRAGAGYKPKTMATRFLAPSMRQVVHPVRRLPRHSTRMLQGGRGKMGGWLTRSRFTTPRYTDPPSAIAPSPVKHLVYLRIYRDEQSGKGREEGSMVLIFGLIWIETKVGSKKMEMDFLEVIIFRK